MNRSRKLAASQDIATKASIVFGKRVEIARRNYAEAMKAAGASVGPDLAEAALPGHWRDPFDYLVDATQRTILFWDTLRKRGNDFVEHTAAGLPPVLHFDYETVVDGRTLARPVNYALVRIVPPRGVLVDPKRRPYVIIDPRAGHGPGIGGFKDDSQVGVALRAGHPVYFVIFYRDPCAGQTLLDVCEAEKLFVRTVRKRHPDSEKPAIVGNCQGGWAAMMLAAADPGDTGPVVINGAPMSYWGGAWNEGAGDNPMRYSGGLLGGTWLASFASDLGDGVFDGAHLVENFENLNPANTFWDKYYHLYANVDTEPPRFLEFERWWGGFYLMNREEIEWITHNLFVGNRLWSGEVRAGDGKFFDLTAIRSPIILFASMGDNITPPQQAFNWVADVYGSTEEIKARGQVIVGLMHESVGHLGIFVSGKVAKKEHAQIVTVLESVESLAPGLYGMQIHESKHADGVSSYEVVFVERRLEDVVAKLNRFERSDEKAFQAVTTISEFNQRAYELFAQPVVQAMSSEASARLRRQFHPLRFQRWAFSDLNPWLGWLGPAAEAVRSQRRGASKNNVLSRAERAASGAISASLEYYRAVRDAASEALFFQTYGSIFSLHLGGTGPAPVDAAAGEPGDLPFVREAIAAADQGGYPEALARIGALLQREGGVLPLARVQLRQALAAEHRTLLHDLPPDQWRRIRGEQEIIVRYAPERALATLPALLRKQSDRSRLLALVRTIAGDERVQSAGLTGEQRKGIDALVTALEATVPAALPDARPRRREPKARGRTRKAGGASASRKRRTAS